MKISVSLPAEDVALLDEHVRLLRRVELEVDYENAWSDWESSGEAQAWESASADGITDAPG